MVPTLIFGMSTLVLLSQYFDNMSTVVRVLCCAFWIINMIVAMKCEEDLQNRIALLEQKLNDEENKDE